MTAADARQQLAREAGSTRRLARTSTTRGYGTLSCSPTQSDVAYLRPAHRQIARELSTVTLRSTVAPAAVMVPARTDTRWFHEYCTPHEVRFLRGRVRFDGHKSGAPFPWRSSSWAPWATRTVDIYQHDLLVELTIYV